MIDRMCGFAITRGHSVTVDLFDDSFEIFVPKNVIRAMAIEAVNLHTFELLGKVVKGRR